MSYQYGIALAQQQDYAGAIAEFTFAIQENPMYADAYYQRGSAQAKAGNLAAAIADYSEALIIQPNQASYYFGRGLAYLLAGSLSEALTDASQAVYLQADYAAAHNLLGKLYQQLDDPAAAIAAYKKAAKLYLDQKAADSARQCLAQIAKLQPPAPSPPPPPPPDPTEFFQQIIHKAKQGQIASAMEDLDWLLQLDRQDAHAYLTRGRIYTDQRDWHNAITDLQQAAYLFAQQRDDGMADLVRTEVERVQAAQARDSKLYAAPARPSLSVSRSPIGYGSAPLPPPSRAIQQQLLRLNGSDRKTVVRLVEQLRLKGPGMPEEWYWEKAIYDLERDRR